jgi:hypothetical protein
MPLPTRVSPTPEGDSERIIRKWYPVGNRARNEDGFYGALAEHYCHLFLVSIQKKEAGGDWGGDDTELDDTTSLLK